MKTEPGDTSTPQEPVLPEMEAEPNIESESQSIEFTSSNSETEDSPTKKKIKTEGGGCALSDLLGDVYVVHEEKASHKTKLEMASDEVAKYQKVPPINMKANPFQWWRDNAMYYPMLSRLAKMYHSVPGTSVPSERVFSCAGDIVTAQRSSLKPKHVDTLIFLKKNLK